MYPEKIVLKPMTEDPLGWLVNFSMHKFILAYPVLLYTISYGVILFMEMFIPVYIYEVWYTGHMSNNKGYIVTFFLMQPFAAMLFLCPIYLQRFGNFPSYLRQHYGSLNTDDAVFNKTIEQEIKKTKMICLFSLILETFTVLLMNTLDNIYIGKEIIFAVALLDNYLPKYANFTVMIAVVIMCYLFIFPLGFLIYSTVHMMFQIRLLIFCLTKGFSKFKTDLGRSITDENYQNHISEILLFCVKHHVNLKTYHNSYMAKIHFPILLLSSSGLLAPISALYFVISGVDPDYNITMYFSIITTVFFYLTYCYYGQLLINESEKFYEALCDTPWIYWNKSNRQILMMLLINASRPFEVTCYNLATLNYAQTLGAFRFCYSICALVLNVF